MVHEPWWELHTNLGRHETCILEKYQDHCRVSEDIFRMTQGEEESLEDYVERFQYNLQRSNKDSWGKRP
jgi:hypothetical protein